MKGFSIHNFADEKYKGGNCQLTVILRGHARFIMINNQISPSGKIDLSKIRREPFIQEVRVLRKTRTYKWYSLRPI